MGYDPRFLSREDRILPGEKRVLTIASPAAGADFTVTVPGNRQWRLDAGRAILTTDATVANRLPRLQFTDETVTWYEASSDAFIAAGLAQVVTFAAGGPEVTPGVAGAPASIALPLMWLPAGTIIRSATVAEDTGDQWSAIAVLIEEVWADDKYLSDRAYLEESAIAAAVAAAQAQTGGQ